MLLYAIYYKIQSIWTMNPSVSSYKNSSSSFLIFSSNELLVHFTSNVTILYLLDIIPPIFNAILIPSHVTPNFIFKTNINTYIIIYYNIYLTFQL